MARIVCIHGIAQEYKSRESLLAEWVPSLRGGVGNAKGEIAEGDVDMAFYGLLFRPPGGKKGPAAEAAAPQVPNYGPGDLDEGLETELLAEIADGVPPAELASGAKAGFVIRSTVSMLQLVGSTPFFGYVAQRFVIRALKQVSAYVGDPEVRAAAKQALRDRISADTRVVVAHSLGTLVAYETLSENPELPVRKLVTLGSPLGMPALLKRIKPPATGGARPWPGGLSAWTNIADGSDIVALKKKLSPIYNERIEDLYVNNGATMHDASPYLTAPETGKAILDGLQA